MGPSLNLSFGLLANPTMLWLTLNPALIVIGSPVFFLLMAVGSLAAILNVRISMTFGLMALLFIKTGKYTSPQKVYMVFFGLIWFLLEMYSMWEGFRVIGAIK